MNIYREQAERPLPHIIVRESFSGGLVRANGSACVCTPPNWLVRWWYAIGPGDRWFCEHGGEWLFRSHRGTPNIRDFWEATLQQGKDT